ncbi:hypothetical protein ACFL13_00110 [Patescibacteria group bacterium]
MSDKDLIKQLEKKIKDLEAEVEKYKGSTKPKIDYSDVDGVVGTFDGFNMVTAEGKEYEIPANYAAKSKLVYGDALKLVEEDGKKLFKHINKVKRKKTDGILTKKEGDWYALTDSGSYRVSDTAADFQKAQLNSQATVLLPEENLGAPFATLDEVEGFSQSRKEEEKKTTPRINRTPPDRRPPAKFTPKISEDKGVGKSKAEIEDDDLF